MAIGPFRDRSVRDALRYAQAAIGATVVTNALLERSFLVAGHCMSFRSRPRTPRTLAIFAPHLESKGTPIGPYDYLIAAQARRRGATLVTANSPRVRARAGAVVGGLDDVMYATVVAAER